MPCACPGLSNRPLEQVCELDRRNTIQAQCFRDRSAEEDLSSDFHAKGDCFPGPGYLQNDRGPLFLCLLSPERWQLGRSVPLLPNQRNPHLEKYVSTILPCLLCLLSGRSFEYLLQRQILLFRFIYQACLLKRNFFKTPRLPPAIAVFRRLHGFTAGRKRPPRRVLAFSVPTADFIDIFGSPRKHEQFLRQKI